MNDDNAVLVPITAPEWVLEMFSVEYGSEQFSYDSREDAIAGYERIVERCAEYEPTLRRDFELISPDGEEEALSPYLGSTEPAILPDGEEDGLVDFHLSEHHQYGYVTVAPPKGNKDLEGVELTVCIKRKDEGVVIDVWPKGQEMDEPLVSTNAFWFEAMPEEKEEPWTLLMKSKEYGGQSYGYASREAAMEGYQQLLKTCSESEFSNIRREFLLTSPDGETEELTAYPGTARSLGQEVADYSAWLSKKTVEAQNG